jgi:hypothetical protein
MKLQNLLFVRSCVPDQVQPVERRNVRTQKIEVHFYIDSIVRLGIKIGYAQSMVVQTVKNTTISRTQIIIR